MSGCAVPGLQTQQGTLASSWLSRLQFAFVFAAAAAVALMAWGDNDSSERGGGRAKRGEGLW